MRKLVFLLRKYGFQPIVKRSEWKAPKLRLIIGGEHRDLALKIIKSDFTKDVWLCKKEDFNTKTTYFLYLEEVNKFMVCMGTELEPFVEIKQSDFKKDAKMIVVPYDIFYPSETLLELMKHNINDFAQKKLEKYT